MYVFQPHVFLPFIYPLIMVRLEYVSISIQYNSMFAFIHLFCMHRARRIVLTTLYFQFQVEYMLAVAFHMPSFRIAEPAIVAFLHALH